jgi:hypothetical protein
MSHPVGVSPLDRHEAAVRALRLHLGLEVH